MTDDDLEKQIDELQTQLKLLRAKKKQLNHPYSLTMTIPEAADVLGMSRQGTYNAVRAGHIPAIRIGNRWLITVAAMKKLLGNTERNGN